MTNGTNSETSSDPKKQRLRILSFATSKQGIFAAGDVTDVL